MEISRGAYNRTMMRVIIVYPTVQPELVVVPILSSICIVPVLVFLTICCLRHFATRRRQRDRLNKRDDSRSLASLRSPQPSAGPETTTLELLTPDDIYQTHPVEWTPPDSPGHTPT